MNFSSKRWQRGLWITGGVVAFAIGFVGIFLPLLPTTPFMLLAAACFIRSSDRLYRWLVSHPWFGSYIRNYRERGGMNPTHKAWTVASLWVGILVSTFLFVRPAWLKPVPLLIAAGVTWHITRLPSVR